MGTHASRHGDCNGMAVLVTGELWNEPTPHPNPREPPMRHTLPTSTLVYLSLTLGCAPAVYVPGNEATVYQEWEPNDSPYQPDSISGVDMFSFLVVQGHVQPPGYFDVYDHFEFIALEPATFDLELTGLAAYSDMDVSLWDPDLQQIVAVWDSPWDPELGTFTVTQPGKAFVLVVEAYDTPSSYDLTLMGRPITYGAGSDGDQEHYASTSAFLFEGGAPRRHKKQSP